MSGMTDETDVYICGICKKEFQDFVAFLQHKSSFGVFKCKLCNLSYHDREDIQKHINQSHANQKVDVAFTIPNKSSIVSTKTEPEPIDIPKSGNSLSVFTCRLCNRFTLVEKSMLQHLESVHKIHVVPRSVELAALMLCSKPLDPSVSKLLSSQLVVKTVTAPTATKPVVSTQTLGTQTVLCTANIIETTMAEIDDSTHKEPEFYSNWAVFAEVLGSADCVNLEEMMPTMTEEIGILQDDAVMVENGDADAVKKVKMESILKANILGGSPKTKGLETTTIPDEMIAVTRESNVCIDGGHDYVSVAETKEHESQEMIVEEQQECIEVPTAIVMAGDVEFTSAYVEPSAQVEDAPISFVEQIVTQDDPSVIVATEPEKLPVSSPPKVTNEKKAVKAISNPISPINKESRRLVSTKSHMTIKMEIGKNNVDEEDDEESDDNDQDESAEEQETVDNDEPQLGADGMYHCRKCKRAFARERQFKAHMNVHIMYGEHVMDSPSSNRAMMGENRILQRKRQKTR